MTDKFEECLRNYREQIKMGGINTIKKDLASGRIALHHKVNAAHFAIQEAERDEPKIKDDYTESKPLRWLYKLQEHPLVAVIVVVCVIIIGLGAVISSTESIIGTYQKYTNTSH